jgi:hypothetical protein
VFFAVLPRVTRKIGAARAREDEEPSRGDERTASLRVLVFSSSLSQTEMDEASRLRISGFLGKSQVSLRDLCDAVVRLLGPHASGCER